jgi:NitT/TauT family transport system substrate-binding protein
MESRSPTTPESAGRIKGNGKDFKVTTLRVFPSGWASACLTLLSAGYILCGAAQTPAAAEADHVVIADQIGLLYLPLRVAVEEKLIEKHAKADGLGDVTVTLRQFSGGGAVNTAILSGSVDIAAGGIPPLLKIWEKTKGTPTEVRAMIALTHMAYKLFTIDPRIKTIDDYLKYSDAKIAVPSAKASTQAVTLEMEAEKKFGPGKAFVLDPLTVSVPHPQAYAAMMSGALPTKSHFATLPFSYDYTHNPEVHLVFSSYDLVGPHTGVVLYNTRKWKEENPKLFKAVAEAFDEAHTWIKDHPSEAADLFIHTDKSTHTAAQIREMITDKSEIEYRPDMRGTYVYAEFLHRIGDMATLPESWKDYCWESLTQFPGN